MGREVPQSSNPEASAKENLAESHTKGPVEELEEKQQQYEKWSSPFEAQETLEYLTDGEKQGLKSLDMSLIEMGEDQAKMIGEAVASHPSLEVLTILLDSIHEQAEKLPTPTSMWPMDSFLTAAFLGEKRNTSVLSLIISSSGTDGMLMRVGVLPQVLRENTHIRRLAIPWHGDDGTSNEEMQDLLEAIQGNSTIESLALPSLVSWDHPEPQDDGFIKANTFKQILKIVQDHTSIEKLDLLIGECRPTDEVNLDDLYIAMRNSPTIRILHLNGPFYTGVTGSAFSDWIRTTVTLKELHLQGDYLEDDESEFLKMLFRALGENKSLRKLELEAFTCVDDDDIFEELMNAIKVNSTLQDIVCDPAPDQEGEIKEALKKNLQ